MIYKKSLSYIAIAALYYPFFAVGRAWVFGNYNGFGGFAIALLMMLIGFISGVLILRESGHVYLRSLLAKLCVVAPLFVTMSYYWHSGWIRAIAEIPFVFVFYFTGLMGYKQHYSDMLNTFRINTGVILTVSGLVAVNYIKGFGGLKAEGLKIDWITVQWHETDELKTLLFILAFLALFLILILKNQFWLEHFIEKHSGATVLPRFFRAFNLIYVCVVFLIIILAFNFKNIVMKVINICGLAIKFIIKKAFEILMLLMPSENMQKAPIAAQKRPELPIIEGKGNSLVALIFEILAYGLLLTVLFFILKFAIKKIISLFSDFLDRLKKVLESENQNGEFVDEIENIDDLNVVKKGQIKIEAEKRIRQIRKDLAKTSDPILKVRYIYEIVLFLLVRKNINIEATDTTGEILRKASDIAKIDKQFKALTDTYEGVRYGDAVPDGERIRNVEDGYMEISKSLQ